MPRKSLHTLVIYDIPHDRSRYRVSEACKDYGLTRFQYSAFEGSLTRNRCEDLGLRIAALIAETGGKITLLQVCEADAAGRIDIELTPVAAEVATEPLGLKLYREEEP